MNQNKMNELGAICSIFYLGILIGLLVLLNDGIILWSPIILTNI